MPDFQLVDPFDIDHGQLEGLDLGQAFALGVEWAIFRDKLSAGRPFVDLVITQNAERLSRLAERYDHFVETHEEVEGWTKIIVGTKKGERHDNGA